MTPEQVHQYVMQALQQGGSPQQIAAALAAYAPPQLIAQVLQAALAPPPTQAPPQQWGPPAMQAPQQQQWGPPQGGPPPMQQQQQWQPAGFGGGGMGAGGAGGQGDQLNSAKLDQYAQRLGSARAGNHQGRQLPAATSLVEVTEVRAGPTYYGDKFFVEFVALESTNGEVEIGGIYSKSMNFEDKYGHGMNDIRGWLCLAVEKRLGQNARVTWDPRFLHWSIAADQPCKKMKFRVDTWERAPTKPGGNAIMIHEWQSVPDETTTLGLTRQAHAPTPTMPMQQPQPQGFAPQFNAQPQAPAQQQQWQQPQQPQQPMQAPPQQQWQQPQQAPPQGAPLAPAFGNGQGFNPPPPGFGMPPGGGPPPVGQFPQQAPPNFAPPQQQPQVPSHIAAMLNGAPR